MVLVGLVNMGSKSRGYISPAGGATYAVWDVGDDEEVDEDE
jgi:hypothetical protein